MAAFPEAKPFLVYLSLFFFGSLFYRSRSRTSMSQGNREAEASEVRNQVWAEAI